jgi:hypothetical protein
MTTSSTTDSECCNRRAPQTFVGPEFRALEYRIIRHNLLAIASQIAVLSKCNHVIFKIQYDAVVVVISNIIILLI